MQNYKHINLDLFLNEIEFANLFYYLVHGKWVFKDFYVL